MICIRRFFQVAVVLGIAFWTATCGDNPVQPATGSIEVRLLMTGPEPDPDGCDLSVDGGQGRPIDSGGTVTFSSLEPGDHTVRLSGVASNCTVDGGNTRTVVVDAGETARVTLNVACVAAGPTTGNLEVTATTSGTAIDPNGYTVTVDGSQSGSIGVNGTVTFADLSVGDHSVQLTGVASNCNVSGANPRTVSVSAGSTTPTSFSITCAAQTGSIRANVTTSGSDIDSNGYTVTVDGSHSRSIGVNGTVTIADLSVGDHSVELSGVASNCSVSGSNPRTVSVSAGGTTSTDFSVTCTATTGSISVTASTSGSNLDPNGYQVTVYTSGGGTVGAQTVGVNGSVTFSALDPGQYSVVLTGVASNCLVSGNAARTVTVTPGGTVTVDYSISCTGSTVGAIKVITSTTGTYLDPNGYVVTAIIPGFLQRTANVPTNGSVVISDLPPATYTVTLSDIANNCSVNGGTSTIINVAAGQTRQLTFNITCTQPPESITRFVNSSVYYLISIVLDGTELLPNTSYWIAPGSSRDYVVSAGTHQVKITNGFLNQGSRFDMYWVEGSYTQPSGEVYSVIFDDPSIQQLLSNFSGAHHWWISEIAWTCDAQPYQYAFKFVADGSYELYESAGSGWSMIRSGSYWETTARQPTFLIDFRASADGNAQLQELYAQFFMSNGKDGCSATMLYLKE